MATKIENTVGQISDVIRKIGTHVLQLQDQEHERLVGEGKLTGAALDREAEKVGFSFRPNVTPQVLMQQVKNLGEKKPLITEAITEEKLELVMKTELRNLLEGHKSAFDPARMNEIKVRMQEKVTEEKIIASDPDKAKKEAVQANAKDLIEKFFTTNLENYLGRVRQELQDQYEADRRYMHAQKLKYLSVDGSTIPLKIDVTPEEAKQQSDNNAMSFRGPLSQMLSPGLYQAPRHGKFHLTTPPVYEVDKSGSVKPAVSVPVGTSFKNLKEIYRGAMKMAHVQAGHETIAVSFPGRAVDLEHVRAIIEIAKELGVKLELGTDVTARMTSDMKISRGVVSEWAKQESGIVSSVIDLRAKGNQVTLSSIMSATGTANKLKEGAKYALAAIFPYRTVARTAEFFRGLKNMVMEPTMVETIAALKAHNTSIDQKGQMLLDRVEKNAPIDYLAKMKDFNSLTQQLEEAKSLPLDDQLNVLQNAQEKLDVAIQNSFINASSPYAEDTFKAVEKASNAFIAAVAVADALSASPGQKQAVLALQQYGADLPTNLAKISDEIDNVKAGMKSRAEHLAALDGIKESLEEKGALPADTMVKVEKAKTDIDVMYHGLPEDSKDIDLLKEIKATVDEVVAAIPAGDPADSKVKAITDWAVEIGRNIAEDINKITPEVDPLVDPSIIADVSSIPDPSALSLGSGASAPILPSSPGIEMSALDASASAPPLEEKEILISLDSPADSKEEKESKEAKKVVLEGDDVQEEDKEDIIESVKPSGMGRHS